MRLITTIALALLGLTTWAQTSLPDLPTGAQRYSQTLWIVPSDSTLWTGATGNYAQVATREQLRQLASQGYTKSQVDSAITSQIGLIDFPVTSVAGKTGDVGLEASDVGLGNVDNTSDADKPISTATQGALDGKENAFSKGSLVAGTGVTLDGTLANRLVGSGNVTINASNPLTASNGLQIISGVISPQYGTLAGTVAQGNDARINNGQTAFNWGDYREYGLGIKVMSNRDLDITSSDANYAGFFRAASTSSLLGGIVALPYDGNINNSRTGYLRIYDTNAWIGWKSSENATPNWYNIWTSQNFTPPVAFSRTVSGLVPSPGGSGSTRFLREDGSWVVPSGGGGGGTATDLSIANRNANTLQIGSSTGNNATVPAATTSLSGLMTAADKSKLNSALTGEDDPTVPGHVKAITSGNISNWNAAYGWGNHAGLYLPNNGTYSNQQMSDLPIGNYFANLSTTLTGKPFNEVGAILSLGSNGGQLVFSRFAGGDDGRIAFRSTSASGSMSPFVELWTTGNLANGTTSQYIRGDGSLSAFTWSNLSGKPSTFTPSPHSHNANDINAGTLASARIPNLSASKITSGTFNIARIPTGTTSSTVAIGNDTRINNGQTAFSWGDFREFGLGSFGSNIQIDDITSSEANYARIFRSTQPGNVGGIVSLPYDGSVGTASRTNYLRAHEGNAWIGWKGGENATPTWNQIWHSGNLPNPATSGTAGSQVRTNTQLDARYIQSIGAGSGISVSGTTVSLANMSANTIKGRSGSTGAPQDLTAAQARTVMNVAETGTGASQTRTNSQLDGRYVQLTGNQSISGAKTFSSPVVVANATANSHAVNLGQLNSVVPEAPNWTQYGIPRATQTRDVFTATGYFNVGGLNSLGVPYWANILANSFVNDGDMVVVKGIVYDDRIDASPNGQSRLVFAEQTVSVFANGYSEWIYEIEMTFIKSGANLQWQVMTNSIPKNTPHTNSNILTYGEITGFNFGNNILIAFQANTQNSNFSRQVIAHPVRVTKYAAKYSN